MRRLLVAGLALGAAFARSVAAGAEPIILAPYVPTPDVVVTRMLELAGVGPDDFVVDLGSGDGRIVIAAARDFGARGLGVDIDAELVKRSNELARQVGVADRVTFLKQDLFDADLSKATVVTLYLLEDAISLVGDKLLRELRPGARVVTHDYPIQGWTWENVVKMDVPEKVAATGVTFTQIFLFVVPVHVRGAWTASLPPSVSREPARLELSQDAQQVWGQVWIDGFEHRIEDGVLVGDEIEFFVRRQGAKIEFKGRLKDGKIEGALGGGASGPWSAAPSSR